MGMGPRGSAASRQPNPPWRTERDSAVLQAGRQFLHPIADNEGHTVQGGNSTNMQMFLIFLSYIQISF